MFGLIPKDEKFFVMFKEMTVTIIEGAQLLKDMMDHFENPALSQKRIKDVEHKADQLTHDIIKKLNKSFVTPLDREDIYALSAALDDILDLIDASAQRIVMYNVENTTPEAKELAFLILKSCQTIDKAVALLGGKHEPIAEYCVEVNALENEADRVCREAISRLFDEEKDPIQLIKWKEIYETLERATDKCEDAANILESVVVKNA
jgi:predicted phosphate transport protein (TIGR00153 family)